MMGARNLEKILAATADTVNMLRNSQLGAYVYRGSPPIQQLAQRAVGVAAQRRASLTSHTTW